VPVFPPFQSGFGFYQGSGFNGENSSIETDTLTVRIGAPISAPPQSS
jgi:hypothetical protein